MEFSIVHEAEEGGYWAEVPALGGCYTQSESVEETLTNIVEAIELHIEVLLEDGIQPPPPVSIRVATVTVAVPSAA